MFPDGLLAKSLIHSTANQLRMLLLRRQVVSYEY